MSDSEEEWWEKDIESFTLEKDKKTPNETIQKPGNSGGNESSMPIDKEILYNLMKNAESGVVKVAGHSKLKNEKEVESPSSVKRKLPFSKLVAISKMSSLKGFMELNNQRHEFFETLKLKNLNKNLLVVACTALLHTLKSPFEEHKYVMMKEIKEIISFWSQLSKYVSENMKNDTEPEFHEALYLMAKGLSRFSDIRSEVRECLKLIGSTEAKRKGADVTFWNDFLRFLDLPSISAVVETILPTREDLLKEPKTQVAPNIVKGAFSSVSEYQKLHMSLLKEDYLGSIRQSLALYNKNYPETDHEGQVDSIHVILRVQLGHGYSATVREFIDLKFNENPKRRNTILRNDKRFLPGTLLILASDIRTLDDLILATVLPYDETLKENGIIPVLIVKCKAGHRIYDGQLILIEPTTFFEPYFRVFNVLSSTTDLNIPMKEYIVDVNPSVRPPAYLKFMKHPNIKHKGENFDITNPDTYPKGEKLGLDESQMDAYKKALTQDFCLIQGPPGTGKTHIGLEVILTLLKNTKEKILIVCYTNHALDQTISGILRETDQIVRFGEQSRSEEMQKFTFKEVGMNRDHLVDAALKQLYWKTKQEQVALSDEFHRIQKLEDAVEESCLEKVQLEMLSVSKKLFELNQLQTFLRIQDKRVFGMTTTYAARCHILLELLEIPIVLIEEAGEILESHIVTSLTPKTQHVILIGDHFQLKPSTSVYRLAKELKMDLSLFERMINNNFNFSQLTVQHRMRPCISELIRGTIYPELIDAPNVLSYPQVIGMTKNMFFVSHVHPERCKTEDLFNETSKSNQFEANFLIDLCHYLIEKGNPAENITILTMYQGQRRLLHDIRLQKHPVTMKSVRISVVDNFQGEENRIILLSLVRSNKEGHIGFVGIKNRVCVALSRAKEGFYVVGNMEMLKEVSPIWKEINEKLVKLEAIGKDIAPFFNEN